MLLSSSVQTSDAGHNDVSLEEEVTKGRPEGVFKILTYNIWETGRNLTWIDVIKEENPDIAVLVETGKWSPSDGTFNDALDEMNALNPDEKPYAGYTTKAVSSTDGEAIISRYPIKLKTQLDELTLDDGTKFKPSHDFLYTIVEIAGVDVHIIGNHLACCETGYSQRLRDQEGLMNFFDDLGEVPIIYTGDFNSHSSEDVGENAPNESNLGTEPIDMMIDPNHPTASKVHTFTDVYRTLNPYSKGFTYVDKQFQSRIDYIFVNQLLTDAMVNSTIVTSEAGINGADHRPILTTFNMNYDEYDLRPPTQVSGFKASLSGSDIKLEWDQNTEDDLLKYQIWRNGCLISEFDKGTTSFVDTSVKADAIYQYSIVPVDENRNYGSKRQLYVNSSYGQLFEPSAPVLTVTSSTSKISLEWTSDGNGSPIKRSIVMRSTKKDTGFIQVAETKNFAYNDTRVRAGVTIYYRIQTYNMIGASAFSNVESGKITSTALIATKENTQNQFDQKNSVKLTEIDCPEPLNLIEFSEETSLDSTTNEATSFNSTLMLIILTMLTVPMLRRIHK